MLVPSTSQDYNKVITEIIHNKGLNSSLACRLHSVKGGEYCQQITPDCKSDSSTFHLGLDTN